MQASSLVRVLAAVAAIAIVALALLGASWYGGDTNEHGIALVGTPTGTYVNGVEVHRLPSITVTARRGDAVSDATEH